MNLSTNDSSNVKPTRRSDLREIFLEAAEMPDDDARAHYLDQACGADASLRKRVKALLAVEAVAGLPPETEASDRLSSDKLLGQRIGRYKLREKIGEGGCGVVYVAEQEEPVRRRVALKVIKLGMDTKSVVARFEAERQALAMMDHPNIAKVLDAGATETGRPYFVMELVRGIRITEYCDQNKLSTRERLDLFIQVCNAVQHAHQKGIIHRDLKPSNILVTLHDGVPVPKVIDFGIAKATEGRLTDLTIYTELHQFIGTPAYMSPEQAEMSGLDIDTRSDIYSLGVLLYELLTGKTPFEPKKLLEAGLDEIRRTIREVEPPRPSTRLSMMVNGDLTTVARSHGSEPAKLLHMTRGDLDWIVMKALEKDRTRRYETTNGLAMDLKRHLNNEAVIARPPSQLYRFEKLVRRNKLVFAAGSAVVLALVGGLGFSTWSFIYERRAHTEAVQAQDNAVNQRRRAVEQEQIAVEQRKAADERARELRRHAYVANMRTAYQALKEGEIAQANTLVKKYVQRQPGEEDLRGFEWRYLWAACQPNVRNSIPGEGQILDSAALSPDGKMMAGWDTNLIVFDVASRQIVHHFEAFDDQPEVSRDLVFSRDGRRLAAKGGHEIRVWNTENWEEVFRSSDAGVNPNGGTALVISPDGATLATLVTNRTSARSDGIGFWNLDTGQPIRSVTGNWPTIQGDWFLGQRMAYSPDGNLLAISDQNLIQLRDSRSLAVLTNLVHRAPVRAAWAFRVLSLAVSTNWVAAGFRDGEFSIWERATGVEKARVKAHATYLTALDFSPDGQLLATGGQQEHVVYLWKVNALTEQQSDPSAPKPLAILKGHTNSISSAHFSSDGRLMAATSRGRQTKLWSISSGKDARIDLDGSQQVLWISPDGSRLIAVHDDDKLYTWENIAAPRARALGLSTTVSGGCPRAISPNGRLIALGRTNAAIELWNLIGGVRIATFPPLQPGEKGGGQIEFSPDSKLLVSFYPLDGIRIRNLADPSEQTVLSNLAGPFALSSQGILAAPQRDGKQIQLWDIFKNRSTGSLDINTGTGWGAASQALGFSRDGRLLAAASGRSDSIEIWDATAGRQVKNLPLSKPGLDQLIFSPDGKTLVARSTDNSVAFWNVLTWEEMFREVNYCPGDPGAPMFSEDGSCLVFPEKLHSNGERPYQLWRAPLFAEIDARESAKAR